MHFEQFHFRSTCKTYKNVTFTRRYPGLCDLLTKHSTDTCLKEKLPSPITFSDHQILDITKIVNDDKVREMRQNILDFQAFALLHDFDGGLDGLAVLDGEHRNLQPQSLAQHLV